MQRRSFFVSWRFSVILFCLLLALTGIVWRLIHLNILDRAFLLREGDARMVRIETIRAHRGMILDRFDTPLAISTPMVSIYMNPRLLKADRQQVHQLAALLGRSDDYLAGLIKRYRGREFVYLKRRMQPEQAQKIMALKIPGIHSETEDKRYYPEGNAMAHVVGITNIDDLQIW